MSSTGDPADAAAEEASTPTGDSAIDHMITAVMTEAMHQICRQQDRLATVWQVLDALPTTGSVSVWTARGPMGKNVLVKTFSQQKMSSWKELESFESECKILQQLRRGQLATPLVVEIFKENGDLHQIQVLLFDHSQRICEYHNVQLSQISQIMTS